MRCAPLNSKSTVLGTGSLHEVSHVTLLVRSLSGKTLVVVSDLDELVSHFCTRLSELTGVLQCYFYLTHPGRVMVDEDTLKRQGCGIYSLICLCSGLKGEWETSSGAGLMALLHVQFARVLAVAGHVFPVSCSSRILGFPKPRHQRETQAGAAAPRVVPPRVPAGNGNGDAQAVLKMLRGLGLSEELLVQVTTSLQPPPAKKVSSRERQMAHVKEQLHSLRGRISTEGYSETC